MTTAQDQQSRELLPCPFCGNPLPYVDDAGQVYEVQCGSCGGRGTISADYARAVADWNRRAPAVQAARALPARGVDPMLDIPAGMKPVAEIFAGDLFRVSQGPDAEPVTGDHDLYTAAQVLAMLAQGLAPGWQAVPVEPTIAMLIAGDMPRISTEQTTKNHASYAAMLAAAPQPPAAPATTEPQAPTTGAGSVTAGAAPAYRLLQPGVDTIQATDEVLADDVVTWKAVGRGIFAGMTYIGAMLPVRRALKTGP